MMCPRLCAIGALLVVILDQILRPPSLMSCCYQCGVPRAVCCCLLFPQGLLRGFGERHYSSKSLRGTLLVRFTFSPQTPALLPGAAPATYSLCLQQQYQGKKQLMFSHICFFSPKRDPPHPCQSSASPMCLTHSSAAGCRSEQLSSQPRWLPLYLLKNETHFYFKTNNHFQCLCSMIF